MNFDFTPLWISGRTALVATIICFFLGTITAWILTLKKGKVQVIFDGLFILPMVLPPTVLGFFLLLIFGKNGPIGKLLFYLGINVIFSWPATVLAAFVVAFPLMYKTARGAFEQIDSNLLNAARTLGVSEWRIFWTITLPLAWHGIASGTVLAFTRAIGEFGATLMIAGNIPGKTQTIPIAIFFAVEGGDMNKALTWVVIIFVISLTVILVTNFWTNQKKD
ncbi:molybdate ABC transporter permease subunit [Clostridium cellulovorans]|uniref:Molybdenum transport system permease n=1 Tax=Clostridium cellulovorans (strain ATCC 35296 / DSM 3052 / OCM 3 / 743B) TaxID=573061 RepID=D9SWR7_CLOC7|nr:molybdate ABC transporter permease subunit [Clostridium cellulovorans]ADL51278.1 molybdate ABC transporter, inner membrane subunit [Clostridium cellulovorans 743B]